MSQLDVQVIKYYPTRQQVLARIEELEIAIEQRKLDRVVTKTKEQNEKSKDLQYKSKEVQYKLHIERKQRKRKKREAERAERQQKGLHAYEVITAVNLQREAEKAQRAFERQLTRQEAKVKKEKKDGSKLALAFAAEKKIRDNESGIRKYFLYDLSNSIDVEIVRRIEQYNHLSHYAGQQELLCRRIFKKRMRCRTNGSKNTDSEIEQKLLQRCLQTGKTRTEYMRELFCIHFNIKEEFEGVKPQPIPEVILS